MMTSYMLFTCTYYANAQDIRFQQCLETLAEAQKLLLDDSNTCLGIVVVDGSPADDVHMALQNYQQADARIVVTKQTGRGGKGVALREAADLASKSSSVSSHTYLCWLEPEKTSMVSLWRDALQESLADVMVPWRSQQHFQQSYPIEQFHSETYGNFFLDAVMNQAIEASGKEENPIIKPPILSPKLAAALAASESPLPTIDWHFGPFCFQAQHIKLWTRYGGTSYDAQLVPIVHAMRQGLQVSSVMVDFTLDERMKQQEQGSVDFIEKRLTQLASLDPVVKKAWKDDFYFYC